MGRIVVPPVDPTRPTHPLAKLRIWAGKMEAGEASLWRDLEADHEDVERWHAYARWFRHRGDPRGELVEIVCALRQPGDEPGDDDDERRRLRARAEALIAQVDANWWRRVARVAWTVECCGPAWKPSLRVAVACRVGWSGVKRSVWRSDVGHCEACDRDVLRCSTAEEAAEHARRRRVVAFDGAMVKPTK